MALYRPGSGFFHRVHPVTKILALMLAFVPPFLSGTPAAVLIYLAVLFVCALRAGAWPNLRRMAVIMGILFVMSVVLWTFFHRGTTLLVQAGPVAVYRESLNFGVTVGLRLNCFVLAALIFLTTTPIEAFTSGLNRLGLPFVVSFALSLSFRLTPLFLETAQTILMAQRTRGLDIDSGGPIKRIRRYVPIIVPILVSGLRRSDQLAVALESKGFGRTGKRTVFPRYRVTWRDFGLIAVLLLFCAAMAVQQRVLPLNIW